MSVAMAGVQAAGTILGGIQQNNASGVEAKALEQQAGQELASSQRGAEIARRQSDIIQSNQRAAAGASGAGATDPTVQNLEADVARAGEYKALTALYEGKTAAQGLDYQARMTRYAGQQALVGSLFQGIGGFASNKTIAEDGQSLFDKYAGEMPPWFS